MSPPVPDADEIGWWTCCGSTEDVCQCMQAEACPDCGELWHHCECEREL